MQFAVYNSALYCSQGLDIINLYNFYQNTFFNFKLVY